MEWTYYHKYIVPIYEQFLQKCICTYILFIYITFQLTTSNFYLLSNDLCSWWHKSIHWWTSAGCLLSGFYISFSHNISFIALPFSCYATTATFQYRILFSVLYRQSNSMTCSTCSLYLSSKCVTSFSVGITISSIFVCLTLPKKKKSRWGTPFCSMQIQEVKSSRFCSCNWTC